ncbi:hypothetical protein Ancab_036091 [Ancistrocladus abbreviatus]
MRQKTEKVSYSRKSTTGKKASNQVSNRKAKFGNAEDTSKCQSIPQEGHGSTSNHNFASKQHAEVPNDLLTLMNKDYNWDNGQPRDNPPINNPVLP